MNISPEKTAIHRKKPSVPLLKIINRISKFDNILDYGCGYGEDVNTLRELGFNADGYDKYIKNISKEDCFDYEYDVINCFYVLNTIPTIKERQSVLMNIKNMSSNTTDIYIAVRSEYEYNRQSLKAKSNLTEYKDGVITSKNTFQKYFNEDDFIWLIGTVFSGYKASSITVNKNVIMYHITLNEIDKNCKNCDAELYRNNSENCNSCLIEICNNCSGEYDGYCEKCYEKLSKKRSEEENELWKSFWKNNL